MPEPAGDAPPSTRPNVRSVWLSPAGISAIAGVAGLVLVVVGWFFAGGFRADSATPAETGASDSPQNLIFVYGSAMPGQWGYSVIERYVESSIRDEVDGELFDSGRGYPLAKFELGASIPGFLIELDEATLDDAMRALTEFEGGLFHAVEVRTRTGKTALAFEWIGSTDGFPRVDAWDSSLSGEFGVDMPVTDLVVGECFDPSATPARGVLVNCASPHVFEVFFVHDLAQYVSDEESPGQSALLAIAEQRCGGAFAEQFGREPGADEGSWYVPTESSWAQEVRSLVCAARANS